MPNPLQKEQQLSQGENRRKRFGAKRHQKDQHSVNNRIAAYMLAISRVAHTIKVRGIYA